jgi:hypothetical protein
MSKEIHALKDRTGQIFWPATATDAVIHPNTRLSLTDHIERYNLTSDDLILTLQDGIDKLVELEIDQHLGVQLVIKTEEGLIEEWTYYNSEEEFTSPEGWRKGGEIDTTLDATSENPVQNKAVYQAIIDNEEITAAALTELEERTATVETLKADLVNGKVPVYQIPELPASLLPTSLDDVLEFGGIGNFPSTGSTGIIYVDTETNKLYRWKPGNNSNTPGNYIQLTTDLDIKSLVQPESSTPLEIGDSYDTAFGKLVRIIRDNEIVTAEALQDLNGRITTSSADLSGKADLVDGKVPASQLPSFVDDVIEVGTYSSLPVEGESGKIYIVTDTNKSYRWSGSTYFEIAGGSESPLVIDLDEIYTLGQSVGHWSPDGNENYYWFSIQLSNIPNTLDLQEICDAANENKVIYFKRGGQYYQVVKTGHTNNTSCLLTAYFNETEGTGSSYTISVNLSNQVTENLTLQYWRSLHYKDVLYPVKKGIAIVTGEVIASMLGSIDGVTIDSSSYYAIDLTKNLANSENPLMPPANVFYSLAGNADYDQRDSHFNLNRPVFLLKGIDSTTGVFNLLPLEKVDINYSMSSALETSQNITLKGEDSDNIYEVSISLDNAGYSVPVRILQKKLVIEVNFNGSEDDGPGNAVFEFRSMHDYTTGWSNLNVNREEIEDAIERGIDIYIKGSDEDDSYLVNKITRSSDYTTLYALSVDHDGLMCSYIIYRTSTQSLTACKGYYKFRDNVNQIKNSIVVLPGIVITSMLDPNATVNSDSYYALKVNSLFSTTGSARLYTEKELFDELVGSTRYSSDANLIRPILFFNGVDQVTSIINLIPLKPSNIDFSLYWSTPGQGITLKAEGEDNIYTIAISSDNNTTPLTVTTTPKIDLESIIEEGQKVTAAGLNDLNERVLQNRSDIDELEEVTSVSLNTLNERVEDLEDDVQGILDKENLIETTYLELKDLRDSGKLESGRFYRITDYQCTTSQGNTASAGHQFDIVVLALGKDTLSENAWATMHDTDVYDVTFVNGITKKCYLYEYNTNDGEWNIVDVDTLTGITGRHAGEGEDIIINESNKTATCADSSTDLTEENLTYNYFQNCNLSAWKLKYALEDTTIRRFSWSVPGFLGGEVLTASTYNERIQYFRRSANRTKTINGTSYYEWELVYQTNNTSYPYYYTASENPLNGEDLIWYAANQGGYTTVSGQVISVDVDKDFGGRGIIYYMKDEHENECSYDFKNILFKRWAGNTVNDYIDGLDSYGGSGDTVGYVHWLSSGSGSIWGINLPSNGSTYQPTYYYTFTKRVSVSNPNCKNIDNSLTSTDINNTSGSNGNSIKSRYSEGAITLNDIIILSGNYNKFGFNCYSITVAGGSNNEFGNGCYDIRMRASSCNKFGSRCLYIYLSSSSNNTFGNFCNYLKLSRNSTYNRLGDGCNNCYLGQYSAYCIFNNHCEYVNFNNRSYYRNITVESGNKYITLSCTSTTSSSQYYQNVTIAKGISGTYSNPKTISDSNVNQNYQTIYKPANCQEISV